MAPEVCRPGSMAGWIQRLYAREAMMEGLTNQRKLCRLDPWVREDPLEKGMATHSSILAWRIPWTEEPGGLQFTRSQGVRHD